MSILARGLVLLLLATLLLQPALGEAKGDIMQPFILTVQPIVVRGDDGLSPASMAIPEELVDLAYQKAGVDFYFLEPLYYDNTEARDGLINLDRIVIAARSAGVMRGHGEIVNMFFVNAVDGQKGPLGRGLMGGDITFIALAPNNKAGSARAQEAFVIAHEVGHNLGLKHAVDDENVPNDLPNIQGDGPFEDRIDPEFSLNDYQVELVRRSPLVRPRIDILSVSEGQQAILDETFEPFFSNLQKREVEAFVGRQVELSNLDKIREFARQQFSSAVMPFSDAEAEQLRALTHETVKTLSAFGYDRLANHPWRFVKVAPWLCGGFAYTRGNTIVLSQKHIDTLMSEPRQSKRLRVSGGLIVHEQMHSLQRSFPKKFESLNTKYWNFVKAEVEQPASLVTHQVSNPDAPLAQWLIPGSSDKQFYWMRTLLRETTAHPIMGKDFVERMFSVQKEDGRYELIISKEGAPVQPEQSAFEAYAGSFPVTRGIDHPNEIAAYMFADVFRNTLSHKKQNYLDDLHDGQKENAKQFLRWIDQEM